MIADDGDERHLDAALEHIGGRFNVPFHDDDNRWCRARSGVVGEVADSSCHQDTDIGLGAGHFTQCRHPHRLAAAFVDGCVAEGHIQREHPG